MEILRKLQFLKKKFMSIFNYRTNWNGKLLIGSITLVLLLFSGTIAIQINNKTVSEQNVPIDYYMMSTSLTAEEVEQFAAEIKNNILTYNWDALAEKISYPIVISGITVHNREDFLKLDIDGNLNQEFVDAINEETCKKMFCNWQGVSMGATGQIWFGNVDNENGTSELLIIGIHDMLDF